MESFDYYDILPKGMDAYLASHGHHFSKPMLEWAVGMMRNHKGEEVRLIDRKELDEKLGDSKEELSRLEEELQSLERVPLTEADMDRAVRYLMGNLKDFVTVRNLNNAQMKQLVEKIEVNENGAASVYLRSIAALPSLPSASLSMR